MALKQGVNEDKNTGKVSKKVTNISKSRNKYESVVNMKSLENKSSGTQQTVKSISPNPKMPKRTSKISSEREHKAKYRKNVLVIGDWLIDENWVTGVHRSATSSRTGRQHFRGLNDTKGATEQVCAAGLTGAIIHRTFEKVQFQNDQYTTIGIGICHVDDEKAIEQILMPANDRPLRTPFSAFNFNVTTTPSGKKTNSARFINLANLVKNKDKLPSWATFGTTRVIRIFQHTGRNVDHITRIDWEPRPFNLQGNINYSQLENLIRDKIQETNPKHRSIDAVVIKDNLKNVINDSLIGSLADIENLKKVPWYISSKEWLPKWFNNDKIRMLDVRLVVIPTIAAETAIRKTITRENKNDGYRITRWINPRGYATKSAVSILNRLRDKFVHCGRIKLDQSCKSCVKSDLCQQRMNIIQKYESELNAKLSGHHLDKAAIVKIKKETVTKRKAELNSIAHLFDKYRPVIVVLPFKHRLLCAGTAPLNNRNYSAKRIGSAQKEMPNVIIRQLESSIIKGGIDLETQFASALFGAYVVLDIEEMRTKGRINQTVGKLKKALGYVHEWIECEIKRVQEPHEWSPLKNERDFSLTKQYSDGAYDWQHNATLEEAETRWRQATENLGIVEKNSERCIELWRSMTEVDGYVCLVNQKRDKLQGIVSQMEAFKKGNNLRSESCMIVAPPGSGKTHLVSGLAKTTGFEYLTFNITQIPRRESLLKIFEKISDAQARIGEKPLLVFIDEINAHIENSEVWDAFLAPLEEGTFIRGENTLYLKPCFWVFVGTKLPTKETNKWSDFNSRLTLQNINLYPPNIYGSEYRLEIVYIALCTMINYFNDVRRVSKSVLDVFNRLAPFVTVREVAQIVRAIKYIQRGEVHYHNSLLRQKVDSLNEQIKNEKLRIARLRVQMNSSKSAPAIMQQRTSELDELDNINRIKEEAKVALFSSIETAGRVNISDPAEDLIKIYP
jgi:DNA replication protein DnaC